MTELSSIKREMLDMLDARERVLFAELEEVHNLQKLIKTGVAPAQVPIVNMVSEKTEPQVTEGGLINFERGVTDTVKAVTEKGKRKIKVKPETPVMKKVPFAKSDLYEKDFSFRLEIIEILKERQIPMNVKELTEAIAKKFPDKRLGDYKRMYQCVYVTFKDDARRKEENRYFMKTSAPDETPDTFWLKGVKAFNPEHQHV